MIIFDRDSCNTNQPNNSDHSEILSQTQLCMLRIFCQFLDTSLRCKVELLIKVMELRQSIQLLNEVNAGRYIKEPEKPSMENILKKLKEELPPEQRESINQMEEMMETMQMYQEMMSMKEDNE
ncbi:MAG: hypothetical protein E7288_00440 [Lachnospiraceae bacterium]|nr:hypothetical protein [Lachnospiraceae bacterium]